VTPSQACYSLTEASEGCKLHSYQDTGGVWTIGYGHTSGVRPGQVITQAVAETLLKHDMEYAAGIVNAHAMPCTQNQFDALTDFVFNVGPSLFLSSTLLKKHLAGDHQGAANEFPKWKYDNHVVQPGLVTRRAAERKLYLGQ
jgi:lysozyme